MITSTITISDPISYFVPTEEKKNRNFSGAIPDTDIYIKEVIYNNPATIVFWSDGTKTVCKCKSPDLYSREVGLAFCMLKKILGVQAFHKLMDDWIPEQSMFILSRVSLRDVMKKNRK